MITHEEVKVIIKKVRSKKYCNIAELNKIIDYVTQQEKKDERAKKVGELLDLYRLQQEFKERYITEVRPLDRQKTLDDIREITEEIYLKEEELEEMKWN